MVSPSQSSSTATAASHERTDSILQSEKLQTLRKVTALVPSLLRREGSNLGLVACQDRSCNKFAPMSSTRPYSHTFSPLSVNRAFTWKKLPSDGSRKSEAVAKKRESTIFFLGRGQGETRIALVNLNSLSSNRPLNGLKSRRRTRLPPRPELRLFSDTRRLLCHYRVNHHKKDTRRRDRLSGGYFSNLPSKATLLLYRRGVFHSK